VIITNGSTYPASGVGFRSLFRLAEIYLMPFGKGVCDMLLHRPFDALNYLLATTSSFVNDFVSCGWVVYAPPSLFELACDDSAVLGNSSCRLL
jgi:hypothetical protein